MFITRIGLGALALALACAAPARAQASCTIVLYGEWQLRFSAGAIVHDATLTMSGCTGEMRVAFYSNTRRQREVVTQRMTLTQTAQGVRISGSYPVYYAGTTTRHPTYVVDRLLLSVDPDGRTSFRNCDDMGVCSPVRIVSEMRSSRRQAVQIVLRNDCSRQIYVAMLYRNPEGRWRRRGWWAVGPYAERETDASTLNEYVYFFAESARREMEWHGRGLVGSETRNVIEEAFERPDSLPLLDASARSVSFFRRSVDLTQAAYIQPFHCSP